MRHITYEWTLLELAKHKISFVGSVALFSRKVWLNDIIFHQLGICRIVSCFWRLVPLISRYAICKASNLELQEISESGDVDDYGSKWGEKSLQPRTLEVVFVLIQLSSLFLFFRGWMTFSCHNFSNDNHAIKQRFTWCLLLFLISKLHPCCFLHLFLKSMDLTLL